MTAGSPRRVSVVVPTRDRPGTLRGALRSIRRLEGPDLEFEILVGDNGTSAETARIAAEFGARHLRCDRSGAGAARNTALAAATGDYVAFLDDDDEWTAEHVRPHLALLESRPELHGVVGQFVLTDENLEPAVESWPTELPDDGDLFWSFLNYFPQLGATVVRTRVRESVGPFDETLTGDQDWDWHIRLAKTHPVGFVPVRCVLFRQRRPGEEDALQRQRIRFTRRVFFRHALPGFRKWPSAVAFLRAYNRSMSPYFTYFLLAAVRRAKSGDRVGALAALARTFTLGPVHTMRLLHKPSPLREAIVDALDLRGGSRGDI